MTKPRYTEDFKRMIIELYQTGTSVKQLSKEYGLSEQVIYKWKKKYLPSPSASFSQKDMDEVKRENAKLKEQVEILKKVLTMYAKE